MTTTTTPSSSTRDFLRDVLAGLSGRPKRLPCKYFYDEAGSRLFEQICELPEYYPTRCELAILRRHAGRMMELLDPSCVLIEYGSGAGLKTRLLLEKMRRGATYVPVDISREHLLATASGLAADFPHLQIVPVCADFARPFRLPPSLQTSRRRNVYFSGSTIGNFGPAESVGLLRDIARLAGPAGGLLIGVDLKKDRAILEPAYDDSQGVTAAFNLNLLARINAELKADFTLDAFRHVAFYDEDHGRIEMHLESRVRQAVTVAGRRFDLAAGERICTEYSHKYSFEDFAGMAGEAGMAVREVWTDEGGLFSVQYASS